MQVMLLNIQQNRLEARINKQLAVACKLHATCRHRVKTIEQRSRTNSGCNYGDV